MHTEPKSRRERAIVIGGSMAGLLAARVLANYFQSVLIIDRDDLSNGGEQRRGVPQGRHAHALLAAGGATIEQLIPGISRQLIEAGAIEADTVGDGTWFFEGGGFRKAASGVSGVLLSRPLLESTIRKRVRSLPNIEIVDGHSVRGLIASEDNSRVLGVQLDKRSIDADLVVDSTGRGSQATAWLESMDYEAPAEDKVEVQLVYTTRMFRYVPGLLGDDRFIVISPTPTGKRGGVVALQEGNQFIVTLFGHFGEKADTELEGFIDFAKSLPSPLIYKAIRNAEPIGDAATFRFPASVRRRYERLKSFPEGFLAFGDSICCFNPRFAQGMSVTALEAKLLDDLLTAGHEDLAPRFFRDAAKVIDNPWQIAVGADLKIPETKGRRTLAVRLINRYIDAVHQSAHADPDVAIAFIRVAQLLAPPTSLFAPNLFRRVIWGNYQRRRLRRTKPDERIFTTSDPATSSPRG